MKQSLFLTLFLSFHVHSFSQEKIPEFGKPQLEELLQKECEFDKGAPALKLYKFEKTELISDDMTTKTERWERIKIFTRLGYSFANIEIPYSSQSKIKNLSAIIYNLDEHGNITTQKIEKDEIYKKAEKKKKGSLVFTFPGLKQGSVVEYKFTEVEKEASRYDIKFFQDKIPVQLCIFKIITPAYMEADLSFIGEMENTEQTLEKKTPVEARNTQTIQRKNIASFKTEPFMSSANDNLQYVVLKFIYTTVMNDSLNGKDNQLYSTLQWSGYNSQLLRHPFFGNQIEKSISGTNSIIDSARKFKEISQIVDFIYRTVKAKIKWNENELIYAEDLEKAWQKGLGSSAEINLTIVNLLKKCAVNCYPILVRSREYGKANRAFYSLRQFNSVNALVFDSLNYYVLDGTEKFLSYKTPPYKILNRDVFLIDQNNSKWLSIIDPRPFLKNVISIKATIDSASLLIGNAYISYFDYIKKVELLKKDKNKDDDDNEENDFLNTRSFSIKIDSLVEKNEDELQPFTQNFHFSYSPESTSDYIYIDPFFLSSFRKNPFSASTRQTDIDFGSNQFYSITLHITIPDNFTIEGVPKNLVIIANDSSMTFKRQILQQDNILLFKYSFEIERAIFSKEEYSSVREYFRKIYGAVQEQIILRKR
jgi:Domain of Unknown Function with PDB structure (DUF3857)